ncbi:Uncharacterised protein [uncultured archaeon]|nr:Uncharacterised protein [uncultured archaeon]
MTLSLISPRPKAWAPRNPRNISSNMVSLPMESVGGLRTLVVDMTSPRMRGRPLKTLVRTSPGAKICMPCVTGASVTCLASLQTAFLISTYWPMLVPALDLIRPSILIMSMP